jgi:hypothetical protein
MCVSVLCACGCGFSFSVDESVPKHGYICPGESLNILPLEGITFNGHSSRERTSQI